MDLLLTSVQNKQNVIITSMRGLERSRLLLRSELILLAAAAPTTDRQLGSLKRIYHVLDKDRLINRVYQEATTQLPFKEFGLSVSRFNGDDTDELKPGLSETQATSQLVICNLKYIFDQAEAQKINLDRSNALFVFDGITLDNLEGTCCDISNRVHPRDHDPNLRTFLPSLEFSKLASDCWSVVLACNSPIDGLEAELGCTFPVVIRSGLYHSSNYRVFSSILPEGPSNLPMVFGGLDGAGADSRALKLHGEVGSMLESLAAQLNFGGIVVFFPSYGKMVEYHNAWQQSGVFERIGLPYGRENRGGDHFKNGLLKLASEKKSIFLCSIRYHKDDDLAEFVLGQAVRMVFFVGLPNPFSNDTWNARVKYNNEAVRDTMGTTEKRGRLDGPNLYTYRAIEFLNEIIKRCLNEFRSKSCSFFFLDRALRNNRDKLALSDFGYDAQVEEFSQALVRFAAFKSL